MQKFTSIAKERKKERKRKKEKEILYVCGIIYVKQWVFWH
jgi:hypothetical protein